MCRGRATEREAVRRPDMVKWMLECPKGREGDPNFFRPLVTTSDHLSLLLTECDRSPTYHSVPGGRGVTP